jgi:hypothetical protein
MVAGMIRFVRGLASDDEPLPSSEELAAALAGMRREKFKLSSQIISEQSKVSRWIEPTSSPP